MAEPKKNLLKDGLKKNTLVDTGIKFSLCRIFLLIPDTLNVPHQRVVKDFANDMKIMVNRERSNIIVPDMSVAEAMRKAGSQN